MNLASAPHPETSIGIIHEYAAHDGKEGNSRDIEDG
jgi:hypothetical protein